MFHIWIIVHNQITNIRHLFNQRAYRFSCTSLIQVIMFGHIYCMCTYCTQYCNQNVCYYVAVLLFIRFFFTQTVCFCRWCRWWPALVDGYLPSSLWGRHKTQSWNHYRRCWSSLAKWRRARMAISTAAHDRSQSRRSSGRCS